MEGNDREQSHEELWKSQEEEAMQVTTEELCARARTQETVSAWAHWVFVIACVLLLGACVYNLARLRESLLLREPLLLFAEVWSLATLGYLVWGFWHGPTRPWPAESCLDFLRRELEGKIQAMRKLRRAGPLLVPAILAAWWGGGPLLAIKEWGIASSGLSRLLAGPWILIVLALLLRIEWLLCTKAMRKFYRELEDLPAHKPKQSNTGQKIVH